MSFHYQSEEANGGLSSVLLGHRTWAQRERWSAEEYRKRRDQAELIAEEVRRDTPVEWSWLHGGKIME